MSTETKISGSSFFSIEANIIIAGLEGIATVWTIFVFGTSRENFWPNTFGSNWSNAEFIMYSIFAVLAVIIIGFVVEAIGGFLEDTLVLKRKCFKKLKTSNGSQHHIWTNEYIYKDFSRRRLRILVTRNTACCFLLLIFFLECIFIYKCECKNALLSLLFILPFVLFTYAWFDAIEGLKNDKASYKDFVAVKQGTSTSKNKT
jgi:hypothetical protein